MLARFLILILAFTFAASLANTDASAARGDQWSLVGERTLEPTAGNDIVDLRQLTGSFMAFRLRVVGGGVRFSAVTLSYSDGSSYAAEDSFELADGESTKILDFKRDGRFIDSIKIGYAVSSTGAGGPPKLQIHGLQSRRSRQARRPAEVTRVAATEAPPLPQSVAQVLPQATGGMLIGVGQIEPGVDRGIVEVRKQIGKFKRVRLEVRDHDIYIHGFRVIYEDGTAAAHEVNLHVPEGRTSDWAAVDGSQFIDRLEISHLAKPELDGLVRIEVMGEPADGWLSDAGEGAKFNDGWVLLGAQPAGFVGFDTGIIPVGEHISGFKEIRVMVHERAITLNRLRIVYEDGDEDIIPVRARINAGSAFGPVELRNAPRKIREIQARYRSRFIDRLARSKGTAIVEVWARR